MAQEIQSSILIVDDDPMNRDMLSRRLAREDYTVATAEGGRVALEMMAAERYDLILLDIMMPEMDGYEVLQRIKADERLRHTPVIMLTALSDRESVMRCLKAGADDYLVKPFNMGEAKTRLLRCLETKSFQDPPSSSGDEPPKEIAVLVVDDEELNRDLLARRVKQAGYAPSCAQDGETALKLLAAKDFDLVLLDIMMPGVDGYEVLSQMKWDERLREIPVIMISALNDSDSMARCFELGADDYVMKPFNAAELRSRLSSCLQQKKLQQRESARRRRLQELARLGQSITRRHPEAR